MQVMADEAETHAVTVTQASARIGDVVAVRVAQEPEIGDVRVINCASAREHARTETFFETSESAREHHGLVTLAVIVAVPDERDAVLVIGPPRQVAPLEAFG